MQRRGGIKRSIGMVKSGRLLLVFLVVRLSLAWAGIINEGPLTVFRTDTNQSLFTFSLPIDLPTSDSSPRLDFEFGFATDEPRAPETFYDSFSITIQKSDPPATALLLTADQSGVKWTPLNPGGLLLAPTSVDRSAVSFPDLGPPMSLAFAYTVSFLLPPNLAGGLATVFCDFYNNLNQFASLAFVSSVQIETNAVPPPTAVVLQSSANARGPYADETGTHIDAAQQVIHLLPEGRERYYQINADSAVRISRFTRDESMLLFSYEFPSPTVVLQSVATLGGPFVDESNFELDLARHLITLPRPEALHFYRLRSNIRATITSITTTPTQLVLTFEFNPAILGLFSSAQSTGPYAEESGVTISAAAQTLSLDRSKTARFYRLRSTAALRINRMRVQGDELVLEYRPTP